MSDEEHTDEVEASTMAARIAELELELQLHRALVERSLQGLLIYNEGGIIFANSAMEAISGYSRQELLGMQPDAFLHPEDLGPIQGRIAARFAGEGGISRYELRVRRKDGSERWVAVATNLVDHEGSPAIVVALDDITDRLRSERALREAEARFRTVVQHVPDYLILVDRRGEILFVNRIHERFRRSEVIGASLADFLGGTERVEVERALADAFERGEVTSLELDAVLQDGAAATFESTVAPLRLADGTDAALIIAHDVTAQRQRRSEEQAIAAERGRIAREIHDGLAQDLTALGIRLGLCEMMAAEESVELRAELETLRGLIQRSVREVRRLIFALRPVELAQLGFSEAVRRLVEGFADHNHLAVDLDAPDGPALPRGLELVLFRVIQEALHNVARHARASRITVQLRLEEGGVVLRVLDDGEGLDLQGVQDAPRSGHLGLALMRERLDQLGGTLVVQSAPGQGTMLEVRLPA
jgi:PAS domain S-box-containing protein